MRVIFDHEVLRFEISMQIPGLMEHFDGCETLVGQEGDGGQAELFIFGDEVFIERVIKFFHYDI